MPGIDVVLRRLSRAGIRRGLAGGHWAWWVIAGAAFVLRRARRREDLRTTIDLKSDERYLVTLRRPGDSVTRDTA